MFGNVHGDDVTRTPRSRFVHRFYAFFIHVKRLTSFCMLTSLAAVVIVIVCYFPITPNPTIGFVKTISPQGAQKLGRGRDRIRIG